METVAYHFHDEDGMSVGQFQLHAGKLNMLQRLLFDVSSLSHTLLAI